MSRRAKKDPKPAGIAGGAVSLGELLDAMGAVLRARKILHPYVAGLFSQSDFTLEKIDTCLAEAQLRLQELCPKPPPMNDAEGGGR